MGRVVRATFVPVEHPNFGTGSYPIAWCYPLVLSPGNRHETVEVHAVVSNFLVFESLARLAVLVVPECLLVVDSSVQLHFVVDVLYCQVDL